MKKTALIIGINGMDGSHLADFLLEKEYVVFGIEKNKNRINSSHLIDKITFLKGDVRNKNSILEGLKISKPDEVYNLAAQSFATDSWTSSELVADTIGLGVLRVLEAIREYGNVKLFQALSSEMIGRGNGDLVNENTSFSPKTPYGAAKLYGYWMMRNYRESYNMFNCGGILFNHESERRNKQFLTRKITHGVAKIHLGLSDTISLGSINASRDWGYAPDFVEAMWSTLQQSKPDDYVIATGQLHTIKDILKEAFKTIGISDWSSYLIEDKTFYRPSETETLIADISKAKNILQWSPKTSFSEMIHKMVKNDIKLLQS